MLTLNQKQFIATIPEDTLAVINPWDPQAAKYAKSLVQKIEKLGLETFWEGSLALGIAGENDIDLYIFSEVKDFEKNLPNVTSILGNPTYILSEKILWRIKKDDHKIDAGLASKNSHDVRLDILFYTSLKKNPELLKEYVELKTPGLSKREYYTRKNEFYNKITGNK